MATLGSVICVWAVHNANMRAYVIVHALSQLPPLWSIQ